jgi:hypothetical protein
MCSLGLTNTCKWLNVRLLCGQWKVTTISLPVINALRYLLQQISRPTKSRFNQIIGGKRNKMQLFLLCWEGCREKGRFDSFLNLEYLIQAVKFLRPNRNLLLSPNFCVIFLCPVETWSGSLEGHLAHTENQWSNYKKNHRHLRAWVIRYRKYLFQYHCVDYIPFWENCVPGEYSALKIRAILSGTDALLGLKAHIILCFEKIKFQHFLTHPRTNTEIVLTSAEQSQLVYKQAAK